MGSGLKVVIRQDPKTKYIRETKTGYMDCVSLNQQDET